MQFGTIVDVFACLAFLYFLLSLLASGGQEMLAGFMNWRGTYLSKGIDVILDNKTDARFAFANLGDWLRAHFTKSVGRTVEKQYLLDVESGQQPANAALQRVLNVQNHPLVRSAPSTVPSYVPAGNFSTAMLGVLRDGSQAPLFTQVETTISALPDGDLKTTLTLFVQDAGGDIDKLRKRLESWFDDSMDRVAGVYKRMSQYALLIIGLILAVALNVDSLHVMKVLWGSPEQRAAIVSAATQAASPDAGGTTPSAGPATPEQLRKMVGDLEAQHYPIGWGCWLGETTPPAAAGCLSYADATKLHARHQWDPALAFVITALPGWLMTAFAISLGAPFWFGLLQNVVNLRNAGAKPNRAADQPASGGSA